MQMIIDVIQAHGSLNNIFAVRNFFDKFVFVFVVLIVDLTDNFLKNVFQSDKTGHFTVLVENNGDIEGDLVTSIVNGKDCVFTCYQDLKDLGDGHTIPNCCLCALERAYREGKSKFKKPISCALYPIRAKDFGNEVYGINYNKWRICKDAIKKGEELNLPVYKFLEGPLVEKFSKEWYDELCEVAEQVLAELED